MSVEKVDALIEQVLSTPFSRREFVRAAGLVVGGAFLAACGAEPGSTATVPPDGTRSTSPTLTFQPPTEIANPATTTAAFTPEPSPAPEPNWEKPGLPPEFREELATQFHEGMERVEATYLTNQGAGDAVRVRVESLDFAGGKLIDPTVSEGMAYFMLLTHNQATFDALFAYVNHYPDNQGLMTWVVTNEGAVPSQQRGAATDAELDIALALILAHRKWGGDYLENAKARLALIEEHLVSDDFILKPGDEWGPANTSFNPSHVSPFHFVLFTEVSDQSELWKKVAARQREVEESLLAQSQTGLMPNWAIVEDRRVRLDQSEESYHQSSWDAVRVPWRHAMLVLSGMNPNPEAYRHSIRVLRAWGSFFENIAPAEVWPGYDVTTGEPVSTEYTDPIFTDAAALALIVGPPEVKRRYWEYLVNTPAAKRYFQESFRLLTLWVGGGVYLT